MLDLKTISTLNADDWSGYVETLSAEDITSNKDLLNMAHGFITCRELMKYNLPKEVMDKIFYTTLIKSTSISLDNLYRKS